MNTAVSTEFTITPHRDNVSRQNQCQMQELVSVCFAYKHCVNTV